jgi:hypothetical protein
MTVVIPLQAEIDHNCPSYNDMKFCSHLLISVLVFGLVACAVRVTSRYDSRAKFSSYKTFCWMDGCEFKVDGPDYLKDEEIRSAIKNSIIRELELKGLKEDAAAPDLLVGFNITVRNDTAIIFRRTEETPIYYRPLPQDQDEIPFLRGTLILAMADRVTSQIVWQAAAVEYMEDQPNVTAAYIEKGIRKVMKRFPPKSGN